jgi:hypothetical protein
MACKHTWETTSAVCRICGPQGSWSGAVSDADASRATRNTITIMIGRKAAEDFISARYGDDSLYHAEGEISGAIKAALVESTISKYNDQEIARFEAIERAAKMIQNRDGSLKLQSGREWQPVPSEALAELEEAIYRYGSDTITITIPLDDAQSLDRRFAKDERMLLADERRVIGAIRAELRRRA